MELFIRIVDGQPFEHPIFGDNFRQAFPDIDVNNLPTEFAKFERIDQDVMPATFEVAESTYTWVNGVVKDVWSVRPMTAEEEAEKRQQLIDSANSSVEYMKGIAQQNADTASNDMAKQAWIEYLNALNVWTLNDPVNPNIPRPPTIRPDGTVFSTNQSGTEPNVIG